MESISAIQPDQKYPPDSVGQLIEPNVPVVSPHTSVLEIKELINKNIDEFRTINYIYITDHSNKLTGVVSIREVLKHDNHRHVSEIMTTDLIYTHPYTHQERAAYMALKKKVKAVPVLDKDHHFLGVIPYDTLLSVLYQEISEDLLKFAGLTRGHSETDDVMSLKVLTSLKHRLPWIIIGLAGGLLIARTIGAFESTLQNNLILAAFIPLMVYMSNAVGQQVSAFVIRDSALTDKLPFRKYFIKQSSIVLLIALIMSTILFGISVLFYGDFNIAKILSVSLFGTITSSILTGLTIPYVFVKLRFDPANASGPVGTVIQDFLSVLIYFTIASLLI
ncbi:MAG: Mg2+ transporter, magnesium transporter [candidate division WWE3 bacterium GW2011_GWC1_41_7]|uniref:Mg2+ transporter, magnesium transporter n=4 Tax=Katanobacteria TaxID=422282 RepID=A0A0G0ZF66_UNCKA|nr:MAG: Mg2+ transporter [candidate division WWE3 bacterium GW2011_GWB1_41_6]KKS20681.1 MAG: Mg2+ transporter, magnesium transporter [candidate division WWE3 bacterium GW2011_GWC1_41_7]KKS22782.1 MAG: Mg2+ transporter [candidate division WWE3 bacterium GW2011_GWA1_41_8]